MINNSVKPGVFLLLSFFLWAVSKPCHSQDSLNMERVSSWTTGGSDSYNDIWGYVASDGSEYAILGSRDSIHIISLVDPLSPQQVYSFEGGNYSVWRDFKTHNDHLFAVCDNCSEGLHVFDLSALPGGNVTHSGTYTSFFGRAHNIFIDTSSQRLYAAGTNIAPEGLVVLDVSSPASPSLLTNHDFTDPGNFYVHDLYVRNDTAYCSHGYTGYYVWDMSDLNQVDYLGSFDSPGYNHSSWNHPTQSMAYYAEEVPLGRPMAVIDLANLGSPNQDIQVVHTFKDAISGSNTNVTPHNPFVKDDSLFISYYEDGIKVYDIQNATLPELIGYYDSYPDNGTSYNGYNGAWGAFPYLPSGNILISDIKYGLNVVRQQDCANPTLYYRDLDNDGYGDPNVTAYSCSVPSYWVTNSQDCDDSDNAINPDATEICDNVDNDCDGLVDDQDPGILYDLFYLDSDGDSFGDASVSIEACEAPVGYVADDTDCDDSNNMVNPGFTEICDGIDNDCDGLIDSDDPDLASIEWYEDQDSDGFGNDNIVLFQCTQPSGYVAFPGDCDDGNADIYPGNAEACDGIDNNCNGEIDESCPPAVPPCDAVSLYINPVSASEYRAEIDISSDGTISAASVVSFYAGQEIDLLGGFEVEASSEFLAAIENCDASNLSVDEPVKRENYFTAELGEDIFGRIQGQQGLSFIFKEGNGKLIRIFNKGSSAHKFFKKLKADNQSFRMYIFQNGSLKLPGSFK